MEYTRLILAESNFYTSFTADTGFAKAGNNAQIDSLPKLFTTLGGNVYFTAYKLALVLFAIALMLAILGVAYARFNKRSEVKDYLVKVICTFVIICAFGSIICCIAGVASDISATKKVTPGVTTSSLTNTQSDSMAFCQSI